MKRYFTVFKDRRHEILAGAFAVLSMVWILQLLFAQGGGVPSPVVVSKVDSPAPSLGVRTDEPNAPDQLARAAETPQTPKLQPKPLETAVVEDEPIAESVNRKKSNVAEVVTDATSQTTITESETPTEADPKSGTATSTPDHAETAPVLVAEPTPQPNSVEETPKLVAEMSAEEIQEAIDAYMAWVHQGDVTLKLDISKLSPQQLNSITAEYFLTKAQDRYDYSPSRTLRINPVGKSSILRDGEFPHQKWISDLPLDSGKWPPHVASSASQAFGRYYTLKDTTFILSDEIALKLFRFLAASVGNQEPQPGAVFVLRLVPSQQNQIQVELVN